MKYQDVAEHYRRLAERVSTLLHEGEVEEIRKTLLPEPVKHVFKPSYRPRVTVYEGELDGFELKWTVQEYTKGVFNSNFDLKCPKSAMHSGLSYSFLAGNAWSWSWLAQWLQTTLADLVTELRACI